MRHYSARSALGRVKAVSDLPGSTQANYAPSQDYIIKSSMQNGPEMFVAKKAIRHTCIHRLL